MLHMLGLSSLDLPLPLTVKCRSWLSVGIFGAGCQIRKWLFPT